MFKCRIQLIFMANEKRRKCFEVMDYVEIHFLGECGWHRMLHDWGLENRC